ncbi:excalibur calcium-binding domain-containing protein [Amaricoccus sp. W119]|jgi:hypothetical protein|uniref:excalibur calcium-binding domain-containing protein n=1 Tax=Amaricoccus sp. W119 TaxID=3391833 RepID=UPI0039A6DD15
MPWNYRRAHWRRREAGIERLHRDALGSGPGSWGAARDYDCGDFSTQAEAQRVYEDAGPGDPYRLDRDHDGVACETLP